MKNVLLKKIPSCEFKDYISSIQDISFIRNGLKLSSNVSNLCLNFKDIKANRCVLKFKQNFQNNIVNISSNGVCKDFQIKSDNQNISVPIGENGLIIIKSYKRNKGEIFLIDEILLYNVNDNDIILEKPIIKEQKIINNLQDNNIIYNSEISGFSESCCNNGSEICGNGVIIGNISNYTIEIPKLDKNKIYFITVDLYRIDGNGKFIFGLLSSDNQYKINIASSILKSYTTDISVKPDQKSYSISIKRPISTKGKIFLSKILITCEDKPSIILPMEDKSYEDKSYEDIEDNFIYKFNKIVFFNFWHNGDIHVSRSFIKYIKNLGYECEYLHNNSLNLLNDLNIKCTNLDIAVKKHGKNLISNKNTHIHNNILYINTWYRSNENIFNKYNTNFDCIYYYFKDIIYKYFGIDIGIHNIWNFFPEINYIKFDIKYSSEFLEQNIERKKIFISNGDFYSGQAVNFNFSPIINFLSKKYKEHLFLISNKKDDIVKNENIYFTKDIINIEKCDLNENSYLSSECDLIIGRGSGTYTFALTKYNYQRDCKFLVFLKNNNMKYNWIQELPITYKANIIGSSETRIKNIYNIIDENIIN